MNKTVVTVLIGVLIAGVAFAGGYLVATKAGSSNEQVTDFRAGPGGAFAQLTDAEREKLRTMTEEERQQFFKDKGIELPEGVEMGTFPGGPPDGTSSSAGGVMIRRGGGGAMEGTVASVDADKITIELSGGGSATVYVDTDTVRAAVSGAKTDLAQGAKVLVYAEPEAEGVTAAKAIIVK